MWLYDTRPLGSWNPPTWYRFYQDYRPTSEAERRAVRPKYGQRGGYHMGGRCLHCGQVYNWKEDTKTYVCCGCGHALVPKRGKPVPAAVSLYMDGCSMGAGMACDCQSCGPSHGGFAGGWCAECEHLFLNSATAHGCPVCEPEIVEAWAAAQAIWDIRNEVERSRKAKTNNPMQPSRDTRELGEEDEL